MEVGAAAFRLSFGFPSPSGDEVSGFLDYTTERKGSAVMEATCLVDNLSP